MSLTITRLEFQEVRVPAKAGTIASKSINKPLHKLPVGGKAGWSVQFDELTKLILKLELSDGTIGWGEFYRDHNELRVRQMAAGLIGQDITKMSLQRLPLPYCREYDGFECAIWDAYAKAHQMRVVDLLGGPVRSAVLVGAWSSHRELAEVGPLARHFQEQGFNCIKFKCDLEDDVVAWCQAIDEHAPGMQVILDPNERWDTAGESRRRVAALAEVGNMLCLEDPIPRWQLSEYARLRQFAAVPIALHVSLPYVHHGQRVKDAIQALQAEAVDGFNFNGGFARFKQLDNIADAAGLPCWHGSEVDLGILEAAYVHVAAGSPSCTWPSDIFGRLIREHDLLAEPLRIEPPFAHLPEGDGLGIEVDEDALRKYSVSSFIED